jgi:tetratricopeptide (TPR) repeat protein
MATIPEMMAQAVAAHRAGRLRQAEQHYRAVLAADPNHGEALGILGVLAYQADRPDEAVQLLRRAATLRPGVAEVHSNLGAALEAAGDVAAAVLAYREAIHLKPSLVQLHVNLADAYLELGQLDEALAAGLAALQLDPNHPPVYAVLGTLAEQGKYAFAAEDVDRMQTLADSGRLRADHAALLDHALACHRERLGDYDQAFRAYQRANERKRAQLQQAGRGFNRQDHAQQIDTLIGGFTPDFFRAARSFGIASDRPVFVVGMVRSGTSLVEQILASHPQVFGCGELQDISRISVEFFRRCATGIDVAAVQQLAGAYLERLARRSGPEPRRVIDKMPHNFLHLGVIAVLFPQSRVIHCRRDPLDVCASAYTQNFERLAYTTSLEDLGFYYRQYARLMEHWRHVLPLAMHEVNYEDLVAEPERVSRALVEFLGLSWDDQCLAFHQNPRAVQTASKLQVRQPIYKHALARWKRFASHLQPLRDALGLPAPS